jgi:hypothetical protein
VSDDQLELWQETGASVSYLLLLIEILVALAIFGGFWWHRRRGPRKQRFRRSKASLTLHDEAAGGEVESENLFQPQAYVPLEPPRATAPAAPRTLRLIQ